MVFIVGFEVVALIASAVFGGGIVLAASATKAMKLLFLALDAGVWGAYVLISFTDKARGGRAVDVVVSLLGFVAIAFAVGLLERDEIHVGSFLGMSLLLALSTILLSLRLRQRPVVRLVSVFTCIVLALLWTCSFYSDYGTRVKRGNRVYSVHYEMLADGKIMDTGRKGVWGAASYYDSKTPKFYSEADGHFIANYEKEETFYPV